MRTAHRKRKTLPALDRPRVAIVDDDPDFLAIERDWLRPRYDTISFADASELLDCEADELIPDLLITDVKMPGLDGFKLCETLRSNPRFARLPILFLTGVDSDEGFLLGQEAGASAYLTKPVERAQLLKTISELIVPAPDRSVSWLQAGRR